MSKAWVGIDPGAQGALAVLDERNAIEWWDYPNSQAEVAQIIRRVQVEWEVAGCVLEKPMSLPKNGKPQLLQQGINFGIWWGMVLLAGWPHEVVSPQKWRRNAGYPVGDPKEIKKHSCRLAERFYPKVAGDVWSAKGGARDGRAEAILMARFARLGKI